MKTIYASIQRLPQHDLNLTFGVTFHTQIFISPRLYRITLQEVLSSNSYQSQAQIAHLLEPYVLNTYNSEVENMPLLDMIEDPEKYRAADRVEWTEIKF